MQTDELELIAQSLREDADAYGQLVLRYKHAIYHHCFALVRDEDVAEDIAQEAFIAAYYKLDQFDVSRKFSTWLFKIATNRALTYLKKSSRTIPVSDELLVGIISDHPSPEFTTQQRELHDAVARLEPRYQAVVSLYYWQGLDYKEIALVLDAPEGSIKGWMSRAKDQLRKELA